MLCRNDTCSLTILLDLDVILTIKENDNIVQIPPTHLTNVVLGKIPVVVKSKYCITNTILCDECINDPGGYVIINGNEKVIIAQEKIANNSIQVYSVKETKQKVFDGSRSKKCT